MEIQATFDYGRHAVSIEINYVSPIGINTNSRWYRNWLCANDKFVNGTPGSTISNSLIANMKSIVSKYDGHEAAINAWKIIKMLIDILSPMNEHRHTLFQQLITLNISVQMG